MRSEPEPTNYFLTFMEEPRKKRFKMYSILIIPLVLFMYLMGYLFAYPNLAKAFVYLYYPGSAIVDLIEKSVVFLVLVAFIGISFKNKFTAIIGVILSIFITINFILSIYLRIEFQQDLNSGLALSFLGTNANESLGVLTEPKILLYLILATLFFILLYQSGKIISKIKFSKKHSIGLVGLVLLIGVYSQYGFKSFYNQKNEERFRPEKRTYFSHLNPIYYFNDFVVAYSFSKDLKRITRTQPKYDQLIYQENEIENIVVVIGESARRANMSLYGYERDTTPNKIQEKPNMLLYTQAVSPAPLTIISIPLMLSAAMPDDYSMSSEKYNENILTLANHFEFETYWLTTQKFPGQNVSLISVFENYAKNVYRIDGVYDELMLPDFDKVLLEKKRKKLIVLHINGSHATYCDKYPSSEALFRGKSNNIDCYDNSIKYTDKVLGGIFNRLKDTKSVLIYTSDHGTSFVKDKMTFSNTKQQSEVPMFVWYSPKLSAENALYNKGEITEQTQNTILYPMVSKFIGVDLNLSKDKFIKKLRFVNSDLTVMDFDKLE